MSQANDDVMEIARHCRLQWEAAQEAYVLLYPEGIVKLGTSAAEILKRVDGVASVGDIIASLEGAFPGVELRGDVLEFVAHARDKGWIRARRP